MKILLKSFVLCCQFWLFLGKKPPPHIIFIYADDLGWNDVNFHGFNEIPTPNIDALAMSGILLNNYYGYWLCTPSRAALLTGIYPTRLGLQHFVIKAGEASGLPLDVKTLPQHLKYLGYTNRMVGKWHLGHMTKRHTPTYRGFDSHFGYWTGNMDYYTYWKNWYDKEIEVRFKGYDLHNGTEIARNFQQKYATELFTEVSKDIIRLHNPAQPLFLYLAHLAPHLGNADAPLQAPAKYIRRMKHIKDAKKRTYAAMVSALDDSVGQIFEALKEKGMLENSILIFASDNGGETERTMNAYGSNFPLRGNKYTLWEGGNRLPALIWSPLFNLQEPRISMQMMHVTDWLPTLYSAAGGNVEDLGDIDGMSIWDALMKDLPSPRWGFLYNIDPIAGVSAVRVGDLKLINGSKGYDSWYESRTFDCRSQYQENYCEQENVVENLLSKSGRWIVKNPSEWRKKAAISCLQPPPKTTKCRPDKKPCLFDVSKDPCEYNDLADSQPNDTARLMKYIEIFQKSAIKPQSKPSDPRANPACYNNTFVPWLDPEYIQIANCK